MSEAVSALAGETYEGFVTVREAGLRGMITVRGALSNVALKNAVTGVAGTDFPGQRQITCVADQGIAWMSPDELLVMVPYAGARSATQMLARALKGTHHLVADVSDARTVFALKGSGAREVLAKLSPADLSPAALQPGEIRRTRLGQVAAAFWMTGEDRFEVVTFRAQARYAMDLLSNAARPGSEVAFF